MVHPVSTKHDLIGVKLSILIMRCTYHFVCEDIIFLDIKGSGNGAQKEENHRVEAFLNDEVAVAVQGLEVLVETVFEELVDYVEAALLHLLAICCALHHPGKRLIINS